MINFLFSNIKSIGIAIIAFIGVYIFRKVKILTLENQTLTEDNNQKDKVINIQTKDINASGKIKPSDTINDAIDRLSDKS